MALAGLTRSAQCPPRPLYPTPPLPLCMPASPGPGWGVGPMPEQPLRPQPQAPPGSRSPVHAVADPGITDSWAMPRVPSSRRPPAARVRKLAPPRLLPKPPRPRPGLGSTRGALRSRDHSGFLQLQVRPHPPGHVTGEGAAPEGPLELAFPGLSLVLAPSARGAGRGGSLRGSLGLRSGEGPSLRVTAPVRALYLLCGAPGKKARLLGQQ